MIQNVEFDKLKYGDKVASVSVQGELKIYTFLCYDPGFKEKYAFLMNFDGATARHHYKPDVEEMLKYDDYKDIKEYAEQKEAAYYRGWLNKYEGRKKGGER